MAELHCIVVTPEKTELDVQATSLVIPLFDGEIGILPGRAPMIGRLGFGLMTVKSGSTTTKRYVDGGFVQVTREAVYILTDRLLKPESIDTNQAKADLEAANAIKGVSAEAFAIKERALAQARGKLRITK
ncbi:MAG: F0F1 ATP synthase subunit epsilon [Pirellulaceae bacterium]|nr:F0F1 ATP synthase subunit epsilon [Pirellulaceae bacterium]